MGTTCSRARSSSADSYLGMFPIRKPAFTDIERAAKMLYDLSVFGFSRLSGYDQSETIEELRKKIDQRVVLVIVRFPGETDEELRIRTFTEVFKKLQFPDQNLFLSMVMKKFKRERLSDELKYWFKQLDANDQQEELGNLVHVTEEETTNDDFIMARFTQIAGDYTNYVYRRIFGQYHIKELNDSDKTADWLLTQSRFSEIFQGFMIIWFKGQCASDQSLLIQELFGREIGRIEKICELSKHFRLKRFTELCTNVVPFRIQVNFIDDAEKELRQCTYLPHRLLLKPQDHASAYELGMQLSTFAFGLLSYTDQQDNMYNFCRDKIEFYKRLTKKFLQERRLCESILLFREVGSDEQEEIIDVLSQRLWEYNNDATKDIIIKRFSEENEEDFRLRRFIKLCNVNPSLRDLFIRSEAEKWDVEGMLQQTSDDHETEIALEIKTHSRYAEFLVGVSTIWFEFQFANDARNPIRLLLSDDIAENHPDESNDCFRLRRFTESFKQLPSISQEYLVEYINRTMFYSLGPPPLGMGMPLLTSSFDLEFIKVKAPKLGVGVATTEAVRGATTQGATTNRDGAAVT